MVPAVIVFTYLAYITWLREFVGLKESALGGFMTIPVTGIHEVGGALLQVWGVMRVIARVIGQIVGGICLAGCAVWKLVTCNIFGELAEEAESEVHSSSQDVEVGPPLYARKGGLFTFFWQLLIPFPFSFSLTHAACRGA